MGPRDCWSWTSLPLTILAVLLFHRDANGQDSDCFPEIRVARNTVWRTSPGKKLKMNCSVAFCSNSPTPSWCKFDESNICLTVNTTTLIQTQLTNLTNTTWISFLTFKSISRGDAGLYRCELHTAVGHSINVIVSGACPARKSRKEDQTENQYMAIPMTQQAFPRPNPQSHHRGSIRSHQSQDRLQAQPTPPPDCIYDNAPARGPRRTHPAPGQAAANQVAVPVDTDNTYSNGKEKEEESDIMYAALNHQVKPRAAARPAQPRIEGSEYAAIRVS
ncbi:B- and T-lymphocyte attenuator isoform X5 [Oncorhynchus mykiss]|uniref:B- and T-lymphocyte attenuator isoform X5 n=1 Tax=Oncorhynchus mykiss TaxID=8022 RepID=UPI001877610D|nr:B- and T-lymphocyte attenuator isoform X5 [Oncorhynchus mykiss]